MRTPPRVRFLTCAAFCCCAYVLLAQRTAAASTVSQSADSPPNNNGLEELSRLVSSSSLLLLLSATATHRLPDRSLMIHPNDNDNDNRRRSLESDMLVDFDDICEEMRIIFNEQCECGAYAEARSDLVTCTSAASGGLEASAHFNSDANFALETIKVCKHNACTTIHYQNRTGSSCEATYGGGGEGGTPCQSCQVCSATEDRQGGGGMVLGLEIDCSNVNDALSVNCTAVSDVLDLSGGMPAAHTTSLWFGSAAAAAALTMTFRFL